MANATTLQIGAWTLATDAFAAHPNSPIGAIYDLNDGVNWTLVDGQQGLGTALSITAPAPEVYKTGNSRAIGERVTRRNYTHNRKITATLLQLPQATVTAWNANLRTLIQMLEAISPSNPAALKIQLTNGSTPIYADVVEAHVHIVYQETLFAQSINDTVRVEFEARPFLRGARQTLSNLVVNPGFEAPSGPGVTVFNDAFTNANAYTVQFGSAPSVGANQMTLAANSAVLFGSPSWGAINQWQLRWRWNTGLTAYLHLHYTDGNNWLAAVCDGVNFSLIHAVGGTQHTLATAAATLGTGGWYWLNFTQFPGAPGKPPDVLATLFNDAAGAVGSQIATSGTIATYDAVTALSGHAALQANGAVMLVGGAFSNVHTLALFGPGGWFFAGLDTGASGEAAGAWEQNTANTYPGGAVTSYGAARIDVPPAGALAAYWDAPGAFAPLAGNLTAIPATTGQPLTAAAQVKTSGLGAGAQVNIKLFEYDVNGNALRATTGTTLGGNQAAWTPLRISATLGTSTAYVSVRLSANDATSGSAGGVIWFDNVQCWNQATTGQSSMPYCELRFLQSPAQLLVTGVAGDVPSPALISVGAYLTAGQLSPGTAFTLRLGRRLAPSVAWQAIAPAPQGASAAGASLAVLDFTKYGGWFTSIAYNGNVVNAWRLLVDESQYVGTYHLLTSANTGETTPNVGNITVRLSSYQRPPPATNANTNAEFSAYYGAFLPGGFSATNTFTTVDAGQYIVPFSARGALAALAGIYDKFNVAWLDSTPGANQTWRLSWMALLPIDGGYAVAQVLFPANMTLATTNCWLWVYNDGLATQIAQQPSWRWSFESSGLPAPADGVGGTGGAATGYPSINPAADSFLTLDPAPWLNGIGGVNQLLAQWNNQAGVPIAVATEIQYTPLYLWPQ